MHPLRTSAVCHPAERKKTVRRRPHLMQHNRAVCVEVAAAVTKAVGSAVTKTSGTSRGTIDADRRRVVRAARPGQIRGTYAATTITSPHPTSLLNLRILNSNNLLELVRHASAHD